MKYKDCCKPSFRFKCDIWQQFKQICEINNTLSSRVIREFVHKVVNGDMVLVYEDVVG